MVPRLLRADERVAQPWRNGGGLTREVAGNPGDDFGWRISVAEIAESGPFSRFEDCDRTLVLLDGGPATLGDARLEAGDMLVFSGDEPIAAAISRPATAFNVITRRGRFHHQVARHVAGDPRPMLIFALSDGVCIDGIALGRHDAVLIDRENAPAVSGDTLAVYLTES
ncbi:HutD family protein [Sphingomonas sp. ZB1N12]|jgi:environmental stress-induced protein Ves|uniref:HutD/Ves family protein n=1 Tax=Sphingomonas arabinosi TaxID=3096160 RepID=UPI002FC6C43A